jgi:hypothetical protein
MPRGVFLCVFFAIAFCLLSGKANAELSIQASIDKQAFTTDETLTYTLVIRSSEQRIPKPKFPSFTGLTVVSQAQSSSVTLVKGEAKTVVVYVFELAVSAPGVMTIEPASVEVDKQIFSSDSFQIDVKEGTMKTPHTIPKQEQRSPSLPDSPPDEDRPKVTL